MRRPGPRQTEGRLTPGANRSWSRKPLGPAAAEQLDLSSSQRSDFPFFLKQEGHGLHNPEKIKPNEKGGHHEKEVTHAAQAKQRQRRKTGPPRRSQRSKAQPGKAPGRHAGECPSACEEAEGLEVGASSSWDAGSAVVARTRPGEAEEHSGGSPRGTGAGGPGTRAGVLTLREFSMLISQPSNRKNWAIRTS